VKDWDFEQRMYKPHICANEATVSWDVGIGLGTEELMVRFIRSGLEDGRQGDTIMTLE